MKALLLLLVVAAGGLKSEEEPASNRGLVFSASASQWNLSNAAPLAFTPFELGWDFGNGLRATTGVDIFYYRARQVDEQNYAGQGPRQFSYEMSSWRSLLCYRVPLPLRLRPLLGITAEAVGGKRRRAPEPGELVSPAEQARELTAWGFFGAGALAGLELIISRAWSLSLTGRYLYTFNAVVPPLVVQAGANVVF